ncbi:hypothetical protein INR49_019531, partial [Caranx melampygus]
MQLKSKPNCRISMNGKKHSLTLNRVALGDAGLFCFQANGIQTSGQLSVKARDIHIVKELEDVDTMERQSVNFLCEVNQVDVEGRWYRDDCRIRPGENIKIRHQGKSVRPEHAGEIRFTAERVSSYATLTVQELPVQIVRPLRVKIAMYRHRGLLECQLSRPNAQVRWYKNRQEILPSTKYQLISQDVYRQLTIDNVCSSDEDTYTCDAGDDKTSCQLLVEAGYQHCAGDELSGGDGARASTVPGGDQPKIGRPPKWTLNDDVLEPCAVVNIDREGTLHSLCLTSTDSSMSGPVLFVAGKSRSTAQLTVKERPLQVVRHMDDVETKESSSVTLSCQFAPSPRVVRWFKGRTALKTSNKYSMKREGNRAELTIHGLTGIDSGQYRCMAGGSQSTAHVKVEARTLKLVKHLEPVEIEEDGVATFSCELNYVVANVEWLLNNVRLYSSAINRIQHMGTMHSLIIKKLRPQESRVTFKAGLLSETTTLKVKERPAVFLRSLEDAVGEEQGEVCLQCEISKDTLTPVWRKDGSVVTADDKHEILQFGKSMALIIHSLSKDDAGQYTCDLGTIQTKAKVTVHEKPVHIFRDLLNVKAVPGEDAELSCEITKPDATIRWLKNGRVIRQSPRYEMSVEKNLARLVIKNTTIKDSGEYSCEAEGVASHAKLEIRELQHTFARELRDTRAEEKGKVTLECETRRPAKRVKWLRGMMELRSGRKYVIRQKGVVLSLTITCLEKSDTDTYMCDVGTMQSRAQLTVQGQKVLILDELEDVECLEGDTVTFRCRICPSDYIGVRWYLDETLLYTNELNEIQMIHGGYHTLTFKQLARKDTGTISFSAGDKRSYASLLVRERRPTIVKALEDCEAIEGGGLVLSCVTSKPCHILWYKDGCLMWSSSRYFASRSGCEARMTIREVCNRVQFHWRKGFESIRPGDKYVMKQRKTINSLTIKGVKPEDSGEYTCQCRDHRTTATVKVHERVRIVKELQDITVTAGEDAEFVCELSHSDVSEGVWWLGSSPLQRNEMNQMTFRGRQHRLVLTMTTPEETGTVAFVIGDERTSASLLVVPKPKVLFEEKPKDVVILEGETATLSCTISDFTSSITWRRNHIPLCNGDKYELRKEGKVNLLLIYDVEPLDTGVYCCDTGDVQSSAKLTVTELPPFFQEELQSVEAEEGGSVSLYCELSKLGVPIQWKKNTMPLRASRKYEIKQDGCFLQLRIKELELEDSGSYT